jgi:hypothetical protein
LVVDLVVSKLREVQLGYHRQSVVGDVGHDSGCEKRRVHRCELDNDRRAKMALASEMDATGILSILISHAPRIHVCYQGIRALGVLGAMDASRIWLFFSKKHNPAVR